MPSDLTHLLVGLPGLAAPIFVSGLWKGGILVAAAAICLRLLPGVNARVRFALWMLTFTLAAALPLLSFPVQYSGPAAPASVVHAGRSWALAIGLTWLVLMAARAAALLRQGVQLHKVWKRADPVTVDGELLSLLRSNARPAVLCVSNDVDSPGMIGFFRPRLLIPRALYSTLKPQELRQILLHECAHLRRNDDWVNLLQKTALVLFPLNLALVWIDRRLGSERELACDALVIAANEAPLQYARCLTELAEQRLACRHLALLLPAWSRQPELSRRVHSLLHPVRVISPRCARASAILVCMCLAGTVFELGRLPRLVSFESGVADVSSAQSLNEVPAARPSLSVVSTREEQPGATAGARPPRAELVSAIMPPQRPPEEKRLKSASRERQVSLRASNRAGSHAVVPPFFSAIKAGQTYNERRLTSLPAARLTGISTSYAAVPFGDGWLIIQL